MVNHVIIPAAGLGTRFLPWTKAVPKELLPIGNYPAIQLILQEIVDADINHVQVVISPEKTALVHYLSSLSVDSPLMKSEKNRMQLATLDRLLSHTDIAYVQQEVPAGLGDAVLLADPKHYTAPFVSIILPDDLIIDTVAPIKRLIDVAYRYQASVIAVQEVPIEQSAQYGMVAVSGQREERVMNITRLVEKPAPCDAPSSYAVVGRYVLSNTIFTCLERLKREHRSGEMQLTDAIQYLVDSGETVLAYHIPGKRYDIGNPTGWLEANNAYALSRKSL